MSNIRIQALVQAPVVTLGSPYVSGYVLGDLKDIPLGSPKGAAILKSIKVIDIDNQKPPLTILFFGSLPSSSLAADFNAANLTSIDAKKIVAKVNIVAADYETVGNRAIADVEVSKVLKGGSLDGTKQGDSRHVWMHVITTGTPQFTTTDSIRIIPCILSEV